MNLQVILALGGIIAAFGGVATGIVALRKAGTDNVVNLRTVANAEADSLMEGQGKWAAALSADNIAVHKALMEERDAHEKTRGLLADALVELQQRPPRRGTK